MLEREKANAKKAPAGRPRPHQSNVTQESLGVAQAQSISELHTLPSSTTPAITAASAVATLVTSHPDVLVIRDGRWTRFRLLICCVSAQRSNGHL
jgi:hypothetical protein